MMPLGAGSAGVWSAQAASASGAISTSCATRDANGDALRRVVGKSKLYDIMHSALRVQSWKGADLGAPTDSVPLAAESGHRVSVMRSPPCRGADPALVSRGAVCVPGCAPRL